ncbi:MAG: PadR family transcriptional regulator [Firmicutes bacterium]|nr:PadR family transcriptional regulator [Bacillota bacterium]
MAIDNRTVYIILGLLNHEPMSGYDMKKRIEVSISQFWDVGFGQLYPTLKKLEADGMIVRAGEHHPGRPDRYVYSITDRGRQLLRRWLEEPASKEYVRYEILLKLFFGGLVGREANIAAIEAFRARYSGAADLLAAYGEELRLALGDSPDHLYYLLTVIFGEKVYKAYLEWAEEALKLLQSHQSSGGDQP